MSEVEGLKNQVGQLQSEMSFVKAENTALDNALQDSMRNCHQVRTQLVLSNAESGVLKQRIQQFNAEKAALEVAVKELTDKVAALEAEKKTASENVSKLEEPKDEQEIAA